MNERMANVREADMISGREAAALLPGVTYTTLMRWAREGEIPSTQYVKRGKRMFARADVLAMRGKETLKSSVTAKDTSAYESELPGQRRLPV